MNALRAPDTACEARPTTLEGRDAQEALTAVSVGERTREELEAEVEELRDACEIFRRQVQALDRKVRWVYEFAYCD